MVEARRPVMTIGPELEGFELGPLEWSWDTRDAILYALGVGTTVESGIEFLYEGAGPKVLPTFGVIPYVKFGPAWREAIDIDLRDLLHAGQTVTLHRPIPARGRAMSMLRLLHVWDKTSAAILEWETVTSDDDGPLCTTQSTSYVRGGGGFGGERGPRVTTRPHPPDHAADLVLRTPTSVDQAALYRLSGDFNPIHIDPGFARAAGFERPFLHGLCTLGSVTRTLAENLCPLQPEMVSHVECRFSGIVFPGDELITTVWRDDSSTALFETKTHAGPALSGGRIVYR